MNFVHYVTLVKTRNITNVQAYQKRNLLSLLTLPLILCFCKTCQPKFNLSLKLFNEIQEQLADINIRLEKLEEQIAELVENIVK